MTKITANIGTKGIISIEKGKRLEGLWEHTDVLKVNNADTSSGDVRGIVKKVTLEDVAMVDSEIIRQRDGRLRSFPRTTGKCLKKRRSLAMSKKVVEGETHASLMYLESASALTKGTGAS